MAGRMDGRMDGRPDGWMDGMMDVSSRHRREKDRVILGEKECVDYPREWTRIHICHG